MGALRITAATTTLTLLIRIIEFAPLLLPRFGMCAPPRENEFVGSGSAHSFDNGKTNGVVPAHAALNGLYE